MRLDIISAHGCCFAKTPNIDRLAHNGVSFMHSYSVEPVCAPSRTSRLTGKYPSEHGVIFNNTTCHEDILDLGQILNRNGYNAVHVGFWHMLGRNVEDSFYVTHEGTMWGVLSDQDVTKSAKAILRNYDSDKALFLNISYFNPHDCCFLPFDEKTLVDEDPEILIEGLIDYSMLPPLPDTYDYDGIRNATVEYVLGDAPYTSFFDDTKWRYYGYKYARLCEMVDGEIGAILDEIEHSMLRDNTIIIFTSDHGEACGGHRMNGKGTLWDESVRIPMIVSTFSDTMGFRKGVKDYEHFVSSVDVFSTVCDIAGIEQADDISGISMCGIVTGTETTDVRGCAYSESIFYSRMIRTKRYKYIMDYAPNSVYDDTPPNHTTHKIYRELLYDMDNEGEKLNMSNDREYAGVLLEHRKMLFDMESRLMFRKVGNHSTLARRLRGYYEHFNMIDATTDFES